MELTDREYELIGEAIVNGGQKGLDEFESISATGIEVNQGCKIEELFIVMPHQRKPTLTFFAGGEVPDNDFAGFVNIAEAMKYCGHQEGQVRRLAAETIKEANLPRWQD